MDEEKKKVAKEEEEVVEGAEEGERGGASRARVRATAAGRGQKALAESGDRWIATVRRSCPAAVLAIWAASSAATGKKEGLSRRDWRRGGASRQSTRPAQRVVHAPGPLLPRLAPARPMTSGLRLSD